MLSAWKLYPYVFKGAKTMRPEDIREFLQHRPFQPFRLTLTDGRTYDVRHPELAMVGRSSVAIGVPSPDDPRPVYDRLVRVSHLHIMQIEPSEMQGTS
jgi:hypothetical protein